MITSPIETIQSVPISEDSDTDEGNVSIEEHEIKSYNASSKVKNTLPRHQNRNPFLNSKKGVQNYRSTVIYSSSPSSVGTNLTTTERRVMEFSFPERIG